MIWSGMNTEEACAKTSDCQGRGHGRADERGVKPAIIETRHGGVEFFRLRRPRSVGGIDRRPTPVAFRHRRPWAADDPGDMLRSRRQHGRDALVVEWCAALVEEALSSHCGRHRPQAHLSAFGLLAPRRLGQRHRLGVRLGEALSAFALAVCDARSPRCRCPENTPS